MSDIIRLLPDAVASQIAAGEVIQRPASALKEMLENAVDAGARQVQVIVRDAGKTLVQVVDDGCGMTENDARMSFERHATSKIRKAEDLFLIRTMGFRGEALASIAAIAQVELRTRRTEDETGILIRIDGSDVKSQEVVSCPPGTSVSVKNLFFNIPARRNFLKSNAAETRHIVEEFHRVAIAHPGLAVSLRHDGNEVYRLLAGNLRQRITGIFGKPYNERLVPLEESSMSVKISGFIAKPQFARKTRGEQYFFVNGRYVRDPYLNHAVCGGMDELLATGTYPSYFINIEADPAHLDVNIHPSKTEVKFDDERLVYSVMKATVKRALGRFSVTPTLDFENERAFEVPLEKAGQTPKPPAIRVDRNYNPFTADKQEGGGRAPAGWEQMFPERGQAANAGVETPGRLSFESSEQAFIAGMAAEHFGTMGHRYLVVRKPGEIMIASRFSVTERIYYSELLRHAGSNSVSQQELFPQAVGFNAADFTLLKEIEADVQRLGFDIREFGNNTFVVHGIPSGMESSDTRRVLEEVLEEYKHHATTFKSAKKEAIARVIARNRARQSRDPLSPAEVKELVNTLFGSDKPYYAVDGTQLFIRITEEELNERFQALRSQE